LCIISRLCPATTGKGSTAYFAFRRPGGRSFTVGRQRVPSALAEELREWRETKEAQAKQHSWDEPSGYNPASWPPFTIEEADA